MRSTPRWIFAFLFLLTTASAGVANTRYEGGKEDIPVRIELEGPDTSAANGSNAVVSVRITADADFTAAHLSLETAGRLTLPAPAEYDLGALRSGQTVNLSAAVRYTGAGESALTATVSITGRDGEIQRKRRTLYGWKYGNRLRTGMTGIVNLELDAVEEERRTGRMTEDDARLARRRVRTVRGAIDHEPLGQVQSRATVPPLPPVGPGRPTDEPVVPDGVTPAPGDEVAPRSAGGTVTVQGVVSWLDENGAVHPAFGMTIEIRDSELIGSDLVASGTTDVDGRYFFVVDNDDGFLAGDRDIFVRFRTINDVVSVVTTGGDAYEADSGVHDETPDGSVITENFTCAMDGTGPACGILTGATYIASYATGLNGGTALPALPIEWPGGATDTSKYTGSKINLLQADKFDWDVFHHEYGHHVMATFGFQNNPGGNHSSNACDSMARMSKDVGTRLAWGEGWPTYFGISGQQVLNLASLGVPRVGDTHYQDTDDATLDYDLEDQEGTGEDNERAIMQLFWDLFDAHTDGRDEVQVSDQTLFDALDASDATTLSAAWAALRAGLSPAEDLAYGAIATDHAIAPEPLSPLAGAIVGPSNADFSWLENVGCDPMFAGDSFDLVFFQPGSLARILTLANLTTASRTLSAGEIDTLVTTAGHSIIWAVEGRNTSAPATGPYLGEGVEITVNRPPVANAGADRLGVECISTTGTPVMLDARGSSDPDNDPLRFFWTAPGVVFDDPTSATPTGTFPKGTKTATLRVADAFESDTDTVDVQVVDTTTPTITCPADVVVECVSTGGTPATDPGIAAFLAAVRAMDTCDPAPPVITNDAPSFFPLGTTPVTFTASDADHNSMPCTARVQVVDRMAPRIELSLSPDVLWPPNHKLVDVTAEVTISDVCAAAPTFVLSSVRSNESANGRGDGNTASDTRGVDLGTADVAFQLRAERAGGGTGRVYMITYTAMDPSGNTTQATAEVRVQHERRGPRARKTSARRR